MSDPTDVPLYALRVQPRAARDIEAHLVRLEEMAGPEAALSWREGILSTISSLSRNPRRCVRIPRASTVPIRNTTIALQANTEWACLAPPFHDYRRRGKRT